MAAHRYWRLYTTARSTNGPVLNEVEMHSTIGGADITGAGTASSSDSNSGPAANLFDNNAATDGGTTGGGLYHVTYDFGSAVAIVEMSVTTASAAYSSTSYGPGLAYAAWSDDGSIFHRVTDLIDLSGLGDLQTGSFDWSVDDIAASPTLATGPGPAWTMGALSEPSFTMAEGALLYDPENSGTYEIAGTVAIDDSPDIPVHRRVRLFRLDSGGLVRETWSDRVTGAYRFSGLKYQKYFVVAHDHTLDYNAVIKDSIIPEMPT